MGAGSAGFLFVIQQFPGRTVFFLAVSGWLLFLAAGEWYAHHGQPHYRRALPVLLVTSVSFVGLLSLIEWRTLLWILVGLGGITVYGLFRMMAIEGTLIHIQQKSLRRLMMLLWVFDAYAIVTAFFALGLFFPNVPFWLLVILSGVLFSYISYMIWSMYYELPLRGMVIWQAIIALTMIELVWVVHLLPFGYLVAGFLVTWVWYIIQLFIRFHLSSRGVVWKKQIGFLVTNAILYALTLIFFVRWV